MEPEFLDNSSRDENLSATEVPSNEMSQARQRLSVSSASASNTAGASNTVRATNVAGEFLRINVNHQQTPVVGPIRNTIGRFVGATFRSGGTHDTTWSSVDDTSAPAQTSFVLDMPFGGMSSRQQPQVSPGSSDGSNPDNVRHESDPEDLFRHPIRNSRQPDLSSVLAPDPPNQENEGLAGQASSFWDQAVSQNPELSGLVRAVEKYIPFLIIVVVKYLFEHATGIFVFLGLMITFYHGNSVVRREVSRQTRRSFWPLMAVLVNLSACIVFIYFVFSEDELYLCPIFLSIGNVSSLYDLIWYVGINDFVLKFLAVIVKIIVVLLPADVMPHRKRGNYFLFIETFNQLHRSLAPIPIWLHYLLESLHSDTVKIPAKVLGVILTAVYMVLKGAHIATSAISWKNAALKLLKSTRYGRRPSTSEVKASGNTCPICHDNYQEPTILHCKHIFCEECVSTWFDRERTCPMCRSQITDDPAWRDGSTSQFIQLF